jgi:hypothetical protein
LIVSIDYDETYSLDPAAWEAVCTLLLKARHDVYLVTGRLEEHPISHSPNVLRVFYTNHKQKRVFMETQGIDVDVWIDDKPESIIFDFNREEMCLENGDPRVGSVSHGWAPYVKEVK